MSNGMIGYAQGYIADQTQLLQTIVDGLAVWNKSEDPLVSLLCAEETREIARVAQAPLTFQPHGDGANPDAQKQTYRLLQFPLSSYSLSAPFTKLGLQDALVDDVIATANGAMAGDAERITCELMRAIFTKRTAGSVGTAYQAGFFNGETDAPNYGNFSNYGSAANHYAGLNTTTFAKSQIVAAVEAMNKFGYGMNPSTCVALFNTDQKSDVSAVMDSTASIGIIATPERIRALDQGVQADIRIEGVRCIFHPWVPSGYFAVIDAATKPLAKRVHPNPEYRGLMIDGPNISSPRDPLVGAEYLRRVGFAVRHLGAGVCRQLVGSTTYTNPTFRLTAA